MSETLKFGNGVWAVKEGSTLAYNDENGNYKPLPFTFDRAGSATRVNKQGLIEVVPNNEPRIDFLNDSKGALLLEPTRSNLYTYSNDVSFWTKDNVVTTSDYAISPDGTQNAFKAAFSSSTGSLYINAIGTTGTNNTLSVWAKSNNGSSNKFRFFGNGYVTLSNDYVATDEWQRFEFTYNCTFVTSGLTGASDSDASDILFYGFQHEVGSYATSYIPTQGSIGTRVADFAEQDLPNDNILIDNNSTIYFEVDTTGLINNIPNTGGFLFKNSGGTSQLNFSYGYGNIYSNYYTGSTGAIIISAVVGTYKFAFPLTSGSYLYVNGVQQSATSRDWSVISISEIEMSFGHYIKDFRIYNEILSNTELQALTTI